jgi:hypothetical protein
MNKQEKLQLIKSFVIKLQKFNNEYDKISNLFNIESDFMNSVHDLIGFQIKQLSQIIGDEGGWLEWYIYDNDLGKREYEAGYEGSLKKIKNEEDLLEIIELKK